MQIHRLRRPCLVALCTLVGLALIGGCLHSPIDILSGATPKSAPRQATTLQGSYILHIHTTPPFTSPEAARELAATLTHSKQQAPSLAGHQIDVAIPNTDSALVTFATSWQNRLRQQGITLEIHQFDAVMLRSRVLAGKYSVVLGPADLLTLPNLPNNTATTVAGYEMR